VQLEVDVGESDWFPEIESQMKIKSISIILAKICLILGIFISSCNQATGKPINLPASSTSTPSVPGISQTQEQSLEPILSMDLSKNQGSPQSLTDFLWLHDGRYVLTGSRGVSLFEPPKTGIQAQLVPTPESQIPSENPTLLTSSLDGMNLAWISSGNTVVYWTTTKPESSVKNETGASPITGLTLNPDNTDLAYSTLTGEIIVWNNDSQSVVKQWQLPSWQSDLSFSPDGERLAGVTPSEFTATIFTRDGQVIKKLEWTEAVNSSLFGAFFSPNWAKIAWVSQGAVQLMDVETGNNTFLLSHQDAVGAFAWAPDSNMIATSSILHQDGSITPVVFVWDANSGKILFSFPQTSPVQSISFAPDMKSLAILDVSGQVHIWSIDSTK
jgi:WD40 repeat protein